MKLVENLLVGTMLVKRNENEGNICAGSFENRPRAAKEFCRWMTGQFGLEGVCITCGSEGCAVHCDGQYYVESPGIKVDVEDPVGAGDAFAAGFLYGRNEG